MQIDLKAKILNSKGKQLKDRIFRVHKKVNMSDVLRVLFIGLVPDVTNDRSNYSIHVGMAKRFNEKANVFEVNAKEIVYLTKAFNKFPNEDVKNHWKNNCIK